MHTAAVDESNLKGNAYFDLLAVSRTSCEGGSFLGLIGGQTGLAKVSLTSLAVSRTSCERESFLGLRIGGQTGLAPSALEYTKCLP